MSGQTDQDRAARLADTSELLRSTGRKDVQGTIGEDLLAADRWLLAEVDRLAGERDRARREGIESAAAVCRAVSQEYLDAMKRDAEWITTDTLNDLTRMVNAVDNCEARIRALAAGGEPEEAKE